MLHLARRSIDERLRPDRRDTCAVSKENLRFVLDGYERFNAGERAPGLWYWDPEAEDHAAREDPDAAVHRGIEAIARQLESWFTAYPDLKVEPIEAEASGDVVFLWVRFSGHGAASGAADGDGIGSRHHASRRQGYSDRRVLRPGRGAGGRGPARGETGRRPAMTSTVPLGDKQLTRIGLGTNRLTTRPRTASSSRRRSPRRTSTTSTAPTCTRQARASRRSAPPSPPSPTTSSSPPRAATTRAAGSKGFARSWRRASSVCGPR